MSKAGVNDILWCCLDGLNGLHAALNEAVEKLSDDKVDASGMDAYTQQITKVGGVCMLCPHACCACYPPPASLGVSPLPDLIRSTGSTSSSPWL